MRFRPKNPNSALPARHTLYLAVTGGGKSQALASNPAIPKKDARVILWDASGDHDGLHYHERAGFLRALSAGIKRGHGFRVAYAGPQTVENFEWFCEVVWAVLDGNVKTFVIAEELSAVCRGTGKATENAAVLLNQGRKYGLEFHGTSQKPQEVSKTYFDQCPVKWIGQQKSPAMIRRMSEDLGITQEQIRALQPLQFYVDEGRVEAPRLVTVQFREKKGVRWMD